MNTQYITGNLGYYMPHLYHIPMKNSEIQEIYEICLVYCVLNLIAAPSPTQMSNSVKYTEETNIDVYW